MRSVTSRFPGHWRVTVTVRRSRRDAKGNLLPSAEHTVADCLVTTQASVEEPQSRSESPDTSAYLYAPAGSDFLSIDQVDVPDSPLWPSGLFQVSGEPDKGPLGVRVPLRRP